MNLSMVGAAVLAAASTLPANWMMTGRQYQHYDASVADAALQVQCRVDCAGFGTAMQMISAARYAGATVRFSADVRSDGVRGWAGLWMRVDGNPGSMSSFDNMQNRPIKGSTGWARYSVVLPVDKNAKDIAFGVLLNGEGSVAIRNLSFETVSSDVAPTVHATKPLPFTPNLNLGP